MTHHSDPPTRDSRDDAARLAEDVKAEAAEAARSLKETATAEAERRGQAAKDRVADEISGVGDALRRASDDLREGSPQERMFGQMAGALADLSDTVRDKDFGSMAEDLSQLARRNPTAFLGGAALLGFLGVRVAKASERNRHKAVDLSSDEDDDALEAEMFGTAATGTAGSVDYDPSSHGARDTSGIPGPATHPVGSGTITPNKDQTP